MVAVTNSSKQVWSRAWSGSWGVVVLNGRNGRDRLVGPDMTRMHGCNASRNRALATTTAAATRPSDCAVLLALEGGVDQWSGGLRQFRQKVQAIVVYRWTCGDFFDEWRCGLQGYLIGVYNR